MLNGVAFLTKRTPASAGFVSKQRVSILEEMSLILLQRDNHLKSPLANHGTGL